MSHQITNGTKIIQQAQSRRMFQKPSSFIDDLKRYEALLVQTEHIICTNNENISAIQNIQEKLNNLSSSIQSEKSNIINQLSNLTTKILHCEEQIIEITQKLDNLKQQPALNPDNYSTNKILSFEDEYIQFIAEQEKICNLKTSIINELKLYIKDIINEQS